MMRIGLIIQITNIASRAPGCTLLIFLAAAAYAQDPFELHVYEYGLCRAACGLLKLT